MAKMKKCYYCDFDEYGDSTYEQKDLFKAKIGKIQGDCIFMRSVINESLENKQAEICTFLEGDNKHVREKAGRRLGKGGSMKIRLLIDSILTMTALAIMSSPAPSVPALIICFGILGFLVMESRAVVKELEEWH